MTHALPHDEPFVLCEDSRGPAIAGHSLLFLRAREIITAATAAEVHAALKACRHHSGAGRWVAGWFSFESGYALEPRLEPKLRTTAGWPLLWLGVFERCHRLDGAETEALWRGAPPTPCTATLTSLHTGISETDHAAHVTQVIDWILNGDVYQINLTFPAHSQLHGTPLALHRRLREAQRVAHGAVVHDGLGRWLLSYAPELFFDLTDGHLTARPMKGTVPRAASPAEDQDRATWLQNDSKNRAENLMIVDLLRNDLSRVSVPGTVKTPKLFDIERFGTVHQMTSTITSRLAADRDAVDVFQALFPCGSITGAPKIRAMELIRDLEAAPRNVYTGAIGWFGPEGQARFNVAIRTLAIDATGRTSLGLGGGIVLDSKPDEEWRECQAKAAFLQDVPPPFDLFETMLWTGQDIGHRDAHLQRLAHSANWFGFPADVEGWRAQLDGLTAQLPARPQRVRLLLARSGAVCLQASPLPAMVVNPKIVLARLPVPATSPFLAHKTTHRRFYDDVRKRLADETGCFEVVFVNAAGHVTEGSFTNLFVEQDGQRVTPHLADGVLPGILRGAMLQGGRTREATVTVADLMTAQKLLVGNALRGLMEVQLIKRGIQDTTSQNLG